MVKGIGIIVDKRTPISHWQHRIILEILKDKRFELTLIFLVPSVKSNNPFSLAKAILKLQQVLEEKILAIDNRGIGIRTLLNTDCKNCAVIQLPTSEGNHVKLPIFDIILNLSNYRYSSFVKNISRNSNVWSLFFSVIEEGINSFPGFLEVLENKEVIVASLCKIENANESCLKLISESFFNRGWSMAETRKNAEEGAVSMVFKELNLWYLGLQKVDFVKYDEPIKTVPKWTEINVYLFKFYGSLFNKAKEKIGNKFLGIRPEKWSLFFGKGDFEKCDLKAFTPVPMPKNEFWADPFLFEHEDSQYVFFENYSYITKRGKLSCGKLANGTLIDVKDVMLRDYHLSFPFIFKEKGEIYLMPETSENKRLELYRATNFPVSWELYATAFDGEMVADPVFYIDEKNQRWLFINKQKDNMSPMNSELFIYKVDSLKLKNLIPHRQNPVIIDSRVARNGGMLFKKDTILYRPSQRNVEGIYGRALNINKINKLNLEEYNEEVSAVYYPDFDKNLMAMHHLHQTEDSFVFDAAYKRL